MMKLHFRQIGEGPPLLILHGLFGSGDNWVTMAKQLSTRFSVYLIDLRNHGQSPHRNDWNYEIMAMDIQEFCLQNNLQEIYIAGHSMGGKTTMKLAELFPSLIKKMMIIDIAPKYYPVHHQQIIAALKSIDFNVIRSRKQAEEALQGSIEDIGTKQFLLKNIYWKSDIELAWRFNLEVISNHIDIVGEATPKDPHKICTVPACFIRGEKSNYILNEDEALIQQLYPRSTIYTVKNAGHWIHADNPLALLDLMLIFTKE